MKKSYLLFSAIFVFLALFNVSIPACGDTHLFSLIDEVRRNCSITEEVTLRSAPYYRSWYQPTILEKAILGCPLCGALVKFILPQLKNYGGEHIVDAHCEHDSKQPFAQLLDIASLYHHMGHIDHQDDFLNERIKGALAFNSEIQKLKLKNQPVSKYGHLSLFKDKAHTELEQSIYKALLEKKEFIEDLKVYNRYLEIGKKFIQEESSTLALVQMLKTHTNQSLEVWKSTNCHICKSKMSYKRGAERRADLFALRRLWENGRVDVIMAYLYMHAFSGFIFATDYDIHPSGVERALAIIGFLQERGGDLVTSATEFENAFLSEIRMRNHEYLIRHLGPELAREHKEHDVSIAGQAETQASENSEHRGILSSLKGIVIAGGISMIVLVVWNWIQQTLTQPPITPMTHEA